MSVILVDSFEFQSTVNPSINEVYNINFDNSGSGSFSVNYTGADGELSTVTEMQRGRPDDGEVGNIISDDGTQIFNLRVTLNTPFVYIYSITPNTPAPPECDLDFVSVVVTAETQQGANDGTITATASSSFSDLEYSLNNLDYQSSGAFTGLVPGNYIVYARDSNGCLRQYPASVQGFSNPIVGGFTNGLPVVQVSANNISKWSAAYNPIVIKFQRNDNNIYAVADAGGGYIDVTINGLYDEDQIELATSTAVIIKGGKYNISRPALSVGESSGRSVIRILSPYYGSDTGVVFIEQAKPNYKIEVIITSGDTPYSNVVATGTWSPDLTGDIRADLSTYVQSLVNAEDKFKYDVLNWKDGDRGASYTISYREVWDGSDNPYYAAPYPLYVVYAARQLGDLYGGNMAEYVPFYNEPNISLKAKFMTDFAIPRYWVGLPWDVSFIFSESIVGTPLKVRVTSLDSNGSLVPSGEINSFLLNEDAGYLMTTDAGRFLIKRGALPPIDQQDLIEALGVNRMMMPGDPGVNVEYLKLQIYRGTDENPFFVTQPLLVKAERPCSNDPYIYLKWLNKLGGWNYWRFGYRQDYTLDVSNEVAIKRNVFNWETDQTIGDVTKKTAFEGIQFGQAKITKDEVEGLKGLASAIRVQILSRTSPIQWHTVQINPGSFNLRSTKGNMFELKFALTLPEINIQRQ